MNRKVAILAVLVSALTLGSAAPSTAAPVLQAVSVTSPGASPQTVQNTWTYNYYRNYFYSEDTCKARGRAITDPNSTQYIPGALSYFCHKNAGETKWSMDIYWD